MNDLKLKTKSNSVTDEGIVTVAVAAFGNEDSQGDISVSGSFNKTLKENMKRIKHFLNHNQDWLVGCPRSGREEGGHLVFESELNLDTQLGRDVFSNYKLYQKNNLTLEHSVGVEDMKRDPFDARKVLEWRMWEFSTLYSWGANERTPLLDLKALRFDENPSAAIKYLRDALTLKFSDAKLEQYEGYLNLIEKAMAGKSRMVECECGLKFDYDTVAEHTLENSLLEALRDGLEWRAHDIVYEELQKLEQPIREQIQSMLTKGVNVEDLTTYVHCPKCGRRIYKSEIIEISTGLTKGRKPAQTTSAFAGSRQNGTFSLTAVGRILGQ